ncbi:MAG: cyclic nucleotide-binding domain-containing protein [Acidobacteria bacterium]|nr:cyclic nucleotide-binding domain-containing protein [Acidobacteriota bacterium]
MKTSVIRYRVADFLKKYPPFDELAEADLLKLAASGRVIFHETDEEIFCKNQPRSPAIWIIQQGSVKIVDETPDGERLKDLLGEGDLLGLGRFLGSTTYRNTARTASDVILYSIDTATFEALAEKNPHVARYLAAHFSITERYARTVASPVAGTRESQESVKTSWLDPARAEEDQASRPLAAVSAGISIREAVLGLTGSGSDWLGVVDENSRPLGLVGNREIRAHVAAGSDSIATRVETVMRAPMPVATAGRSAADYFLLMMRNRCRAIGVTADGTSGTTLLEIISDSELSLFTGSNPALLHQRLLEARTVDEWSRLLKQGRDMLAGGLTDVSTVDHGAGVGSEFLKAAAEAMILGAESDMADAGTPAPPVSSCWLLFGHAGRGETIFPTRPDIGVVFEPGPVPGAEAYFAGLLRRVEASFAGCGLRTPSDSLGTSEFLRCRTTAEWKRFFESCIMDPIDNSTYRVRTVFDFQALCGELDLARELTDHIVSALGRSDTFVPILANDTMSSLPPLTFFRGLVVELDGAERDALDLEATALAPIVDAARVFGFLTGNTGVTSTLKRLEAAAAERLEDASVLEEAAQAFRIAAYQQAAADFRGDRPGTLISPSSLSKYDRRLLKTAFDSIQRLLELTARASF